MVQVDLKYILNMLRVNPCLLDNHCKELQDFSIKMHLLVDFKIIKHHNSMKLRTLCFMITLTLWEVLDQHFTLIHSNKTLALAKTDLFIRMKLCLFMVTTLKCKVIICLRKWCLWGHNFTSNKSPKCLKENHRMPMGNLYKLCSKLSKTILLIKWILSKWNNEMI